MTKPFRTLIATAALAVMAGGAQAATYTDCATVTASKVSNTSGCQVLVGESQDFLNTTPMTVNKSPGFFDENDWSFVGKVGTDGFLTGISGVGSTGSFSLATVAGLGAQTLIVFKGGSNDLVGYLVSQLNTSIAWSTPFTDPPFDLPGGSTSQNVSHISVYTVFTIPLPAAGFLLLGALGGMIAVGRRRRQS